MKKALSVFTIITSIMLSSCGSLSPMKSFNNNSNGWKPNGFVPSEGILLVEKTYLMKAQQKKIENFMAKRIQV